ncbi:hypothetical protein KA107_01340 [Candidatus Pacearchaeota archaeon]|nr:hypothetical protein [Candidatus Pacearchaeota archaeon]
MTLEDIPEETIEEYELPSIGNVKILQEKGKAMFYGWINGVGLISCQNPTSLEDTRDFIGRATYILANPHRNKAEGKEPRPFLEFLGEFQDAMLKGKTWMDEYRK